MGGRRGRPPLAPLFRGNIRLIGRVSGRVCAHRQVGFRGRTDAFGWNAGNCRQGIPFIQDHHLDALRRSALPETLAAFIRSTIPAEEIRVISSVSCKTSARPSPPLWASAAGFKWPRRRGADLGACSSSGCAFRSLYQSDEQVAVLLLPLPQSVIRAQMDPVTPLLCARSGGFLLLKNAVLSPWVTRHMVFLWSGKLSPDGRLHPTNRDKPGDERWQIQKGQSARAGRRVAGVRQPACRVSGRRAGR